MPMDVAGTRPSMADVWCDIRQGITDTVVQLPVSCPTCVCLGGPDLDTLFVTTASFSLWPTASARAACGRAICASCPDGRIGGAGVCFVKSFGWATGCVRSSKVFCRLLNMRTDVFDFELPAANIALRPASPRDSARLLVVQPGEALRDRIVARSSAMAGAGRPAGVNDTKVIPAQLKGRRIGRETEPKSRQP